MVYDNIQAYVLQPLIIVLSLITAFVSYKMIKVLGKHKKMTELDAMTSKVFNSLAKGFFVWALAEIIYEILSLYKSSVTPGIDDLFYVIGYIFITLGFSYFSIYMYEKSKKSGREVVAMTIAGIIAGAIVFKVIRSYIFGFQDGESGLQIFLDYFYAIIGAVLLVASSSVYVFFKKIGELGKPLLIIAVAALFDFIGNMLWDYYTWNNTYGIPGIISDLSFALDYVLVIMAFAIIIKIKSGNK